MNRARVLFACLLVVTFACSKKPAVGPPSATPPATVTTTSPAPSPSAVTSQASLAIQGNESGTFVLPLALSPSTMPNRVPAPGQGELDLTYEIPGQVQLIITELPAKAGATTKLSHAEGDPGVNVVVNSSSTQESYASGGIDTSCAIVLNQLEAGSVSGTFDCTNLLSADGTKKIEASGAFTATV